MLNANNFSLQQWISKCQVNLPVEGGLIVTCIVGVGVAIMAHEEGAGTNDDIGALGKSSVRIISLTYLMN